MNRQTRIWAAFAGTSAVPAIFFGIVTPLSGDRSVASVALSTFVFLPYSAGFVLVIGGALYLLCARFSLISWWSSIVGGAVGGLLISTMFALPNGPSLRSLQLSLAAGVIAGAVFSLLHPRLNFEEQHEG